MAKKKRTSKTSKGIHGGGGKVRLTEIQKVLMHRGAFRSMRPVGSRPPAEQ